MIASSSALYLLHTVKQNGGLSLMLMRNSRSLGLCLQQVAVLSLDIRINTRTVPFVLLMLWAFSLPLCRCRSENQARVIRKKDNTIQLIAWFVLLTLIHWKTRFRILFFKRNFQDSDCLFMDSKIHISPFTPKTSMLILLSVCHFIPSLFPIFCFSFKCI